MRARIAVLGLLTLAAVLVPVASAAPASTAVTTTSTISAQESTGPVISIFHGEGCPHCADELAFLDELVERYPQVQVEEFEVWNSAENRALLEQTAELLDFDPLGVPVTIVGERVWIGFTDEIGSQIEAAVAAGLTAQPPPVVAEQEIVDVPLVGPIDVSSASLVVSTLVIGFVDGVNPCSLWVLTVLLAIVLHRGSRGRVLAVGSLFLAVTAGMYALYIAGMYSALDVIGSLLWIRLVIAAVALTFGVLQVKDGLRPGVGPSLSISDARKPGIYRRMRAVADPHRGLLATLVGTIVLAVGVSLLETPCTAGLPLLWTNLLAEQQVEFTEAAVLFALYMAVFLLDELIVFVIAVVTLRSTRMQERHGRLLKLLSGSVLVTLAAAMLFVPSAMQTLVGATIVFLIAGLGTLVLWLVVRAREQRETSVKR